MLSTGRLEDLAARDPRAHAHLLEYVNKPHIEFYPDLAPGEVWVSPLFGKLDELATHVTKTLESENPFDLLLDGTELAGQVFTDFFDGSYGKTALNASVDGMYADLVSELAAGVDLLGSEHRKAFRGLPVPDPEAIERWLKEGYDREQAMNGPFVEISDALTVDIGYRAIGTTLSPDELIEHGRLLRTVLEFHWDAWTPRRSGSFIEYNEQMLSRSTSIRAYEGMADEPWAKDAIEAAVRGGFIKAIEDTLPSEYFFELRGPRRLYESGLVLEKHEDMDTYFRRQAERSLTGLDPDHARVFETIIS